MHFNYLVSFFKDNRYIKINGKPKFQIYKPAEIPDLKLFMSIFNELAIENGFKGIYFVAVNFSNSEKKIEDFGFDAKVGIDLLDKFRSQSNIYKNDKKIIYKIIRKLFSFINVLDDVYKKSLILDYSKGIKRLDEVIYPENINYFPCILPNWDNSPRSGKKSLILKNSNPTDWGKWVFSTIKKVQNQKQDTKIIILKSWNEWAEGNYLEPDAKWGRKWLESFLDSKTKALKNK